MARIPLGNFDQPRVTPRTQHGYAPGGADAVGRAAENLGRNVTRVADHFDRERARAEAQAAAEAKRQHEAMARAQAADDQLAYELHVKHVSLGVQGQVERGEIPYQKASDAYADAVSKIEAPKPTGLDPALAMTFSTGLKRIRADAQLHVQKTAMAAQSADFQSRWSSVLDKLGKLAAMPGADVSAINAKAEAFVPLAKEAGLNPAQIQADLQDFKDNAWTQQATMRITQSENSIDALKVIRHDLTAKDGFYAGRLDANKRNALLGKVKNRMELLANRQAHAADRANAAASKVIDTAERQIETGMPAPAEQWAAWADATRGTAYAPAFKALTQEAQQVQMVMQLSPEAQQTYMQKLDARLRTGGGGVDQQQHWQHIKSAIMASTKKRHEEPLVWNARNLGDAVPPLNLSVLSEPGGAQMLGSVLQLRAASITAMRKRYGPQVPMKLLLPQDVQVLHTILDSATPTDTVHLFGVIEEAVDDPQVYGALMQQVAPGKPALAHLGMLYAQDARMTVDTHWGGGSTNDDHVSSQRVAAIAANGLRILAGKGDSAYQPPKDANFRQAFDQYVGDLFRHNGKLAHVAMITAKAYYVGKAEAEGFLSDEINTDRMRQAIRYTLGDPVNVHGEGIVLPPWGMDAATFEQAAHSAWEREAIRLKLPLATIEDWGDLGLMNGPGGSYYVTRNGHFLSDGKHDITITLRSEDAE